MGENAVEISLVPFLCEIISSNKAVWKLVQDLYMADAVRYYRYARASKWYDSEFITGQSLEREIVAKRVLGLVVSEQRNDVLRIIRKGWPYIYEWVRKQDGRISIERAFVELVYKEPGIRYKEQFDRLKNDDINATAILTIIVAGILGKELNVDDEGYQFICSVCLDRLKWEHGAGRLTWKTLDKELIQRVRKLRQSLRGRAGLNRYINSYSSAQDPVVKMWFDAMGFIFDLEKVSSGIAEDEVLSEREVDEVVAAFVCAAGKQQVELDEAKKFLVAGHMLRAVLRSYRRAKHLYFRTSREVYRLEESAAHREVDEAKNRIMELEELLGQRDVEIKRLRGQLDREYGRVKAEYADQVRELEAENHVLREKAERLQQRLEEIERGLFGYLEEEKGEVPDINLSLVRGVIIGGHQRWAARMREILPDSWRVIAADDPYESSMVAAAQVICFVTGYISHSLYDTAVGEARRRGIPIVYLGRRNEDECVAEIKRRVGELKNNEPAG